MSTPTPPNSTQVAIAGAGPAGAACAALLARQGVDVVLLDAQRFPRFKACGEFMSPQCIPLLEQLGVAHAVQRAGARAVRGMELVGHGKRARGHFVDIGRARAPVEHGWALRREVFDAQLVEHARNCGAQVFEGWRVKEVQRDIDGCVRGLWLRGPSGERRALAAPWTIGADGLRSRVAAALGVQREDPSLRRIALTTRYRNVSTAPIAQAHFFEGGYFALAPVDQELVSVNLVLFTQVYQRAALARDALFDAWVEQIPAVRDVLIPGERVEPVRGLGPLARSTSQQTFDGAALVGDACGYADPITGEGIYFALQGAASLVPPLLDALSAARTDRRALTPYLRARAREIAPRARICRWLAHALARPTFARALLGLVESRRGLADLAVSLSADYAHPTELLRPGVWLRAWRQGASA